MNAAISVGGIPVRLTDERWQHILDSHPEVAPHKDDLLTAIREPDAVVEVGAGALCAIRKLTGDRHIVVLYREMMPKDGFVITGWLTTSPERLLRRKIVWTRPSSAS